MVSDDSVHRDRIDKLDEYERAGVREYWVIDNRPGQQRAWFYQLGSPRIVEHIIVGVDDIYRSAVLPGFWLRQAWLWEESPDVLRAVAELIGPEQMAEALRSRLDR